MIKNIQKHKYKIFIVLILLLSSFLRLYKIGDYMTFLGDEGRDVLIARGILHGDFVFLGPRASAGDFFLGPIYYYMIAPFLLLFNYDPVGPAVMVALIGIATVFLIFLVGKELFGEKAGIFAASLYAVSPLVIAYSRSSWNPNPMPFISILILYLLYKVILKQSVKLTLFAGFLFGIAMQLHYLATFLGVIIVLFFSSGLVITHKIPKKKKIVMILKNYGIFFGGFLIGISPFLLFEIKNGFPNIKTILQFIFTNSEVKYADNVTFFTTIKDVFFRLFARLLVRFPGPEAIKNLGSPHFILPFSAITLVVSSIVALFTSKNMLAKLLCLLWLFVGILLFGFYKKPIYDYYFGFLFPVPFLLTGSLLSFLWDNKRVKPFGMIVSIVVFGVLFIYNLDGMPFKSLPNRQKEQVENIADFVLSKIEGRPYNFALLTQGNSDHGYRYFFEIKGRMPIALENMEKDPQRRTVTEQLFIVCEDQNCQPLGNPLFEVSGFGRAEIVGEWSVSVVKVYKLKHYIGPEMPGELDK